MGTLNRDDTRARIERDDGAPDDTVFIPNEHSKNSVDCYHEDPDCYSIRRASECEQLPRREAQEREGKAPCKICVLNEDTGNKGQRLSAKLHRSDPEDFGLSPRRTTTDNTPE